MLKIINPANETVLRELPEDNAESIRAKYSKAKRAQREWAALPAFDRMKTIQKFRALIIERKEKLAAILTAEMGKPLSQSRNELNGLVGRIDFFLDKLETVTKTESVLRDPGQKLDEEISHEPLGVIGNISAWNYPYFVGANVFVPALLTGNAVLYKPSEFATLTGQAIAEMLHESGVPKEIFGLVVGGAAVGAELLSQPLNGVFFTGSYATGTRIAEAASKKMMKIQLELGGKDPVYVCEDTDVATVAAAVADGAFYNAGQSCCAVERIYVHQKIYESFIEAFMNAVKGFVVGDPTEEKTYIGPLARRQQFEVLDRQVADAKAKGAKLLCGGKRREGKGHYYEPTVFMNCNHSMALMREESFGPIIGIQRVNSDEEALQLMNDTEYGLTASIYTRDRARAMRVLKQVNAGSVYWNCCDRVSPRLPWSGRGHSGIGSTLSTYGIQAFLQPKAWQLRGVE